ncbi:MAG: hypothetical protein H6502_00495 [Candidatus Woesearchaeota archaeon]|nr:MAG: hypothetical protein H6502_00495 [Candidatus Woesearchaeota archaeon]
MKQLIAGVTTAVLLAGCAPEIPDYAYLDTTRDQLRHRVLEHMEIAGVALPRPYHMIMETDTITGPQFMALRGLAWNGISDTLLYRLALDHPEMTLAQGDRFAELAYDYLLFHHRNGFFSLFKERTK